MSKCQPHKLTLTYDSKKQVPSSTRQTNDSKTNPTKSNQTFHMQLQAHQFSKISMITILNDNLLIKQK